ncbi:MAG: transglycosylase [Rikenellaceae bacterium]|nr:transglycosylase [Rikenellaceae bacterium]
MRIKNYISYIVPLLFVVAATPIVVTVTRSSQQVVEPVEEVVEEVVEVEQYLISPYDKIFQEIGAKYGLDRLFLSAIARVESEFRVDAVSRSGAVGLMQIMPSTAKSMGYEREQLFDAETSAEIAAQLLHENNKMLRLSRDFDKTERLHFILACYNAGYSRVADARRLARYHLEDANRWGVVQKYLALLAEPQYYEHELVRSGEFGGSEETISYVRKVMRRYNVYKESIDEV